MNFLTYDVKKLILTDSIKLMQIFDRSKIGRSPHEDNESYLELKSPQMKELVIPAHVTAVRSRGIQFGVAHLGRYADTTLEPKTEKITFENPNVKFTKAYIKDYSIRADSDTPLKLQQCVQEINEKAEVVKKH